MMEQPKIGGRIVESKNLSKNELSKIGIEE